jgi:RHH-type transcriptional regulator, rel operon repressor / antitoxin RelB
MEKQTISFRLDSDKVSALDALAEAVDRDRSYLLNEAVAAYLDIQQWQIDHVKAAIKQADAGQFVEHKEIRRMTAKWRER